MPLRELTVENLAVVERVRLELSPGFSVLTGETGAGKSLVVDAVALALGARASADQVRSGADGARIDAVFDEVPREADAPLDELIDSDGRSAIVRREVGADGRSIARVNDRAVTVGGLAALGSRLGEIHGQHEQQRLTEPARQRALLDSYAGLDAMVDVVAAAYRAWRATVAAAAELVTDAHELARRVELLRHQVDEITAVAPASGEDSRLEAELRAAHHVEEIARAATSAVEALRGDDGAVDRLAGAEQGLISAARHDERFAPLADRAAGLAAELTELARDAAELADGVDLDPAVRTAAEERLALLYDLRRKYGDSLEAVIGFGESAAAELARLEDQEGAREQLRARETADRAELERSAAELTERRRAAAARLAAAVNGELPAVGLRAGAFGVEIEPAEIGPNGADRVTFAFAPNPGEPARALARITSGGEASRLSLALKVVLAAADQTPLLVFDEIDAGVGGRNAAAVGERLKRLSAFHQVVCVTHLAQVAAYADAHLVVGKRVVGERTTTEVRHLAPEERATELAAMLAGTSAGKEAHATAEALLHGAGMRNND
jgi:DNA repair protein RecN (Recombination protein N)